MSALEPLHVLTLLGALGCGLIAGVFWAFSSFIMKALEALPPAHGIAAMQSINVAVINRWFLTPFLGTAAIALLLIVAALPLWSDPRSAYWLAGGSLYFVGTFLVTMLFNVPRNEALAVLEPTSPESPAQWKSYGASWTVWNHVRAAAALAAAAALTIALGSGA